MPSEPCTTSVGKQESHTWNSVTVPAGVIRPGLFGTVLDELMNDSVNQKLPSAARTMCSGLLPDVGTLNCFKWSGGAPSAVVESDSARPVAATVAIALSTRRDMVPPP